MVTLEKNIIAIINLWQSQLLNHTHMSIQYTNDVHDILFFDDSHEMSLLFNDKMSNCFHIPEFLNIIHNIIKLGSRVYPIMFLK